MPINRVFLDWRQPALAAAVDYLVQRFGSDGALDLHDVVLTVPGGRAGRRLLEILVDRAQQEHRTLQPPQIVTIGKLPELLYEAKRPFAGDLTQRLAWIEALRRGDPEHLRRLVPAAPPQDDLTAWLALGAMLARLHTELAANAQNFGDVADCGRQIEDFHEQQRWLSLARIQAEYHEVLDRLDLWDRQTARLFAIRQGECTTQSELILIGLVDLNGAQRAMLDQVDDRATALVFAPLEISDRFDEHGCLLPELWRDATIALATDQIEVVDAPADQGTAVVRAVASFDGRYAAEQIAVGVPDPRIVPYVVQHLGQSGVPARHGLGTPISQSPPYRLLTVAADYLQGRRFEAFAALVRHPHLHALLAADADPSDDWLTALDEYAHDCLPHRITDQGLQRSRWGAVLSPIYQAVESLLGQLAEGRRPLDRWGEPIVDVLAAVFGRSSLDRDDPSQRLILGACESIRDTLRDEHRSIPPALIPEVTGPEALRLLLQQMASQPIAPLPDRHAVELLGWLELPLDDAPALVITGVNDGIVPGSVNADLFLPNQLRRALGIEDNDRRYARDAYALSVLAASRSDLRIVAGRRTSDADPMLPSRLLFACDDETAARRAKAFFSTAQTESAAVFLPGTLHPGRESTGWQPPPPAPLSQPVESMRVTEFRDYLACPYRYYLRHRLKLRGLDDKIEELDGAAFGSLAHDVLQAFHEQPECSSTDAAAIADCFNRLLDRLVLRRFGKEPLAAVRVQVEQLRLRLKALADWQADWAKEGWRIERAEAAPDARKASLDVDGVPMFLRGRIDRIDVHETTGRRIIFDYKTSDTAKSPEQTHCRSVEWIDLQLPLYRHLARGMGIEGPVKLAYIVLPKNVADVGMKVADWNEVDLQSADETARRVVRAIRAELFQPLTSPPPPFFEEFAAICGDQQLGPAMAAEDEEGELS